MNCGNTIAEIQQKLERKRYKVGERNFLFSTTPSPKFLLSIPATRVGARSVSARKENQMWGKKKKLTIVAMPLPKMGGKKNSGCRNYM